MDEELSGNKALAYDELMDAYKETISMENNMAHENMQEAITLTGDLII